MKLGKAHYQPGQICPTCSYEMDCASCLDDDAAPSAGAFSICIRCGSLAVFDDALRLVIPSAEQLYSLRMSDAWAVVLRAQHAQRMALFGGWRN